MGKFLYKTAVLALAISLAAAVPVRAEVIDRSAIIRIGVSIVGTTALTVETHNVSDDALVVPLALAFDPSGAALPPAGNPWVLSGQYVRVVYSSNYGLWGVRIVTDNEDLEGDDGNDVIERIAGAPVAPGADGVWGTPDDALSYGGLVVLDEPDPSQRAPWAWQIFAATQPLVTIPTSVINPDGSLGDVGVSGAWDANWAYLADKNDTGYVGDILIDADGDGADDDPTYFMAVVGSGGGGGTMTSHPAVDPRAGDGDVVIYISSRFANTNWGDPVMPIPFLLSAGSYDASLYVELAHE